MKHYNNRGEFTGRDVIKGKTIELIKKSSLVLGHCSTALTFANLFIFIDVICYENLDEMPALHG